ncbi:hypothetical protein ACET3Z_025898 [Daucus carota]
MNEEMKRRKGYKPKSVRKRKKFGEKENISGNSANRFYYPLSPLIPVNNVEPGRSHASPGTFSNSKSVLSNGECSTATDPVFSDDSDTDYSYGSSNSEEDYDTSMDVETDSVSEDHIESKIVKNIPKDYVSLGSPESICSKCNARLWKEERTN